jgi:hypothetical protein
MGGLAGRVGILFNTLNGLHAPGRKRRGNWQPPGRKAAQGNNRDGGDRGSGGGGPRTLTKEEPVLLGLQPGHKGGTTPPASGLGVRSNFALLFVINGQSGDRESHSG